MTTTLPARAKVTIRRDIVPDEITPGEVFAEYREAYSKGDLRAVGVQAVAEIAIPYGNTWITTDVRSPGLWEILIDDINDPYLNEVYHEQRKLLLHMLGSLRHFEVVS